MATSEKIKKYHKEYYSRPEIKKRVNQYNREYYKTVEGKEKKTSASTKWRNKNLERARKYARDYAKAHPQEGRKQWLKRMYNITPQTYQALFESQVGKCVICKSTESFNVRHKYLCVDHDHRTGKVRGLLCHKCNALLGYSREDIEILKSAIVYLELHSS